MLTGQTHRRLLITQAGNVICVDYASSIETISFLNKLYHKTVNKIYASNGRVLNYLLGWPTYSQVDFCFLSYGRPERTLENLINIPDPLPFEVLGNVFLLVS